MKINKIFLALTFLLALGGCKKELDIINPNQPSPTSAATEAGVISLAQGTIYRNGFFSLVF